MADRPASEDRFQPLAEIAPVGIFRTDPKGYCTYVNPRWCAITGLAAAEAGGEGWVQALHPDDRPRVFADWTAATQSNQLFRSEYRFRHGDGKITWVYGQAAAERDSAGTIVGYLGTITDITIRKDAEEAVRAREEAYRSLFQNSPISLWEEDFSAVKRTVDRLRKDGVTDLKAFFAADRTALHECAQLVRITQVNRAAAALAGAESIEELFHGLDRLFSEDTLDFFAEEIAALAEGRTSFEGTTTGLTLTGEKLDLALKLSVIPGHEHDWSKILLSVVDQTEIKRAHGALRTAKDLAETANRAKSEFLANMSHELRTPLNAIIGFAEIMAAGIVPGHASERFTAYAHDIHTSGLHLLDIINDILDVAKIEAREIQLEEETLRVDECIASVVHMMTEQAHRATLSLDTDVAPSLPPIRADGRFLRQVLLNLVSNAIKFTPAGGRITIGAREDKGGLRLWVTDTGIGIASEDLPKLMRPFAQLDSPYARKHRGTGLGLMLVRSLVGLHGGEVDIQSTLGRGTTVVVRLPAERVIAA
jgi:PAS domain S-box-containing protein